MAERLSNDELDRQVLFELGSHHGEGNAIDRWTLVEKVFKTQVPEFERNDDNTREEFWKWYSYYIKPMKERREIAEAMKDAANEQFPSLLQPNLFSTEMMT